MIENTMSKSLHTLFLMSVLLVCAGCDAAPQSEKTSPVQTAPTSLPSMAIHRQKSEPKQEEGFEAFYEKFSNAVNHNNWDQVVDMTKFPFTFRGQLDGEGAVDIDKNIFAKVFPIFLEHEAFINLDGEAIPTTYSGLLMTRMEGMESITDSSADIHDFTFQKINNRWKLIQVYADLSILKTITEK